MSDQPADHVDEDASLERFALVVDVLGGEPGVTRPDPSSRRFGSSALKVDGSIFAMLVRGHLVVKLPRERVSQLIQDGRGSSFDAGKGRPMKEWLTVEVLDTDTWLTLAREALGFVGRMRA